MNRTFICIVAFVATVFCAEAQIKVNSSGNVGIGMTSPTHKLDVKGSNMRFWKYDGTWESVIINWDNQFGAPQLYVPSANFMVGTSTYPVNGLHGTWCYLQHVINTSDERLKKNIQPIESSLGKLCKLQGKSYDFSTVESKILRSEQNQEKKSFGFIAQEMETVFPELVYAPDSVMNYYGINYIG